MAAPQFPANARRHEPYRIFNFRVLIDGQPVAVFRKMSGIKKTTEVVDWRFGRDASHIRKLPGGTKYEAITLEQGMTYDPVFEQWANLVNNIDGDSGMSLVNLRKDIIINELNLQGTVAISYQVKRAWVSEYQALQDFDSSTKNTVGIQSIKLEHEGWECDTSAV